MMKTFSHSQFLETKVLVFWPKVIFKTLVENSSVVHPGALVIFTPPEIVVGHFHVQRSTKTSLFLPNDGQAL